MLIQFNLSDKSFNSIRVTHSIQCVIVHSIQSVCIHSMFALIYLILGSGTRHEIRAVLGITLTNMAEPEEDSVFNMM